MKMLRRQRGVAVITALLLTTLAITIVASLFWAQQVQVRSMENQRLHLQTKWILRGALDWAGLVLRSQVGADADHTSLDQVWATPLAETRLDQYIERERVQGEVFDATLSGNIIDACSRYNLSNLAKQRGQPDKENLDIYRRLLANLKLDAGLADRTAALVASAAPAAPPAPDGTPPPAPTPASSTALPVRLIQVDDLLSIPGYTVEMVEKLREFVIVLPERDTKVNVNTAPAEVLSAVIGKLSMGEATSLVARRKSWRDLNYVRQDLQDKEVKDATASVQSNYFLVRSRVRLDRAALDAEALVSRSTDARKSTRVEWVRQN
jgi:general secretion pathway protein K